MSTSTHPVALRKSSRISHQRADILGVLNYTLDEKNDSIRSPIDTSDSTQAAFNQGSSVKGCKGKEDASSSSISTTRGIDETNSLFSSRVFMSSSTDLHNLQQKKRALTELLPEKSELELTTKCIANAHTGLAQTANEERSLLMELCLASNRYLLFLLSKRSCLVSRSTQTNSQHVKIWQDGEADHQQEHIILGKDRENRCSGFDENINFSTSTPKLTARKFQEDDPGNKKHPMSRDSTQIVSSFDESVYGFNRMQSIVSTNISKAFRPTVSEQSSLLEKQEFEKTQGNFAKEHKPCHSRQSAPENMSEVAEIMENKVSSSLKDKKDEANTREFTEMVHPESCNTYQAYVKDARNLKVIDQSGSPTHLLNLQGSGKHCQETKPLLNDVTIQCEVCKTHFASRGLLNIHMTIHKRKQDYQCSICQKNLATYQSFVCHKRIHTGEKLFECHLCHRKLTTKASLQSHVRIHTGEKPFHCSQCDKRFIRKQDLQIHTRRHLWKIACP